MFKDDKQIGLIGEYVVWDALTKLEGVKSVVDVREDKRFQEWDVDFLVQDRDRQFTWIEAKTDFYTFYTGNVIYEVQSGNKAGCFERTKAQIVAYYVPQSGNIYLLDVEKMRELVKGNDYGLYNAAEHNIVNRVPLGDCERFGVLTRMIHTDPLPNYKEN